MSRNIPQTVDVVGRGTWSRSALGLNEHDLEEVPALHVLSIMAMFLPDCDQINDPSRFGFRLSAEVHQIPPGSRMPGIGDEPFRHRARPLRGVLRLLTRTHLCRRTRAHGKPHFAPITPKSTAAPCPSRSAP